MKTKSKKIVYTIVLSVFGFTCAGLILIFSGKSRLASNPNSSESISSMIEAYTKDKRNVKLTIGVLKSDQTNYKIFSADSEERKQTEYEYEIGSISKTFTASLLSKAISEGLVHLDDSISNYLPLNADTFYPSILSLATHTSGYGEYPFDPNTMSEKKLEKINREFYQEKINIYQGINKDKIIQNLKTHPLKNKSYGWEYSNFGFGVLGAVLSEVYHTPFNRLAGDFLKNDLGLNETRLGNGGGNLNHYWEWNKDDIYFAAGGFVSTVTDLLKYGRMHLNDSPDYLALSHKTYKTFKEEGFSMGLGWVIDPATGYIWHNGGTSSYTSFLGLDKEHKTVVVILSNYPTEDDSAEDDDLDVLGFTLLNNLSKDRTDVTNVFE